MNIRNPQTDIKISDLSYTFKKEKGKASLSNITGLGSGGGAAGMSNFRK
jgi:hypothetical protein